MADQRLSIPFEDIPWNTPAPWAAAPACCLPDGASVSVKCPTARQEEVPDHSEQGPEMRRRIPSLARLFIRVYTLKPPLRWETGPRAS